MEPSSLRAAVVQSATTLLDTQGGVAAVHRWAARDAELVVFPEAYVGGYSA